MKPKQAELKPQRYKVTCPECGTESETKWIIMCGMGGIEPAICPKCDCIMLCEEGEGNPVEITDELLRGEK